MRNLFTLVRFSIIGLSLFVFFFGVFGPFRRIRVDQSGFGLCIRFTIYNNQIKKSNFIQFGLYGIDVRLVYGFTKFYILSLKYLKKLFDFCFCPVSVNYDLFGCKK